MARCAPVRMGAQRATYERVFKRFESRNIRSNGRAFARFSMRYSRAFSTCPLGPNYRPTSAQHFFIRYFSLDESAADVGST